MAAYYNEIDKFAAAWLRELIKAGHIASGEVDERDIRQVEPADLRGFSQCHFFAGIGVWSYALRAAGWPDDLAVWSGSCPCQSLSASGKRQGFSDQRHLWPAWFRLIGECRPDTIFGEQVASKDGLAWLDLVSADLEGAGYAIGTADTCAAGFPLAESQDTLGPRLFAMVREELGELAEDLFREWWMESHLGDGIGFGMPHIRQRLYFVADANQSRQQTFGSCGKRTRAGGEIGLYGAIGRVADAMRERRQQIGRSAFGDEATHGRAGWNTRQPDSDYLASSDGQAGELADTQCPGWRGGRTGEASTESREVERPERLCATGELGHAARNGWREGRAESARQQGRLDAAESGGNGIVGHAQMLGCYGAIIDQDRQAREGRRYISTTPRASLTNGFWRDAEWLWCRDGKFRPVESGTFPLAHGVAARVGRLRGYGNALNAEQAKAFIEARLEIIRERACTP